MSTIRSSTLPAVVLLLTLFLVAGGGIAFAQESTPQATAGHPVHIHVGACDSLDPAPQYVLNDIVAGVSSDGSTPVESSFTTVDATLASVADGGHAINVHESAENIGNYIACGEIGALPEGDQVAIGLRELNASGYSGIAVLRANGEQLDVTIYLAQGLSGDAVSAASGASDHAHEAAAATIEIADFAYNPGTVTINAGESVTWTNNDSVPHTATAQDRSVLQSGTLQPGDSYTQQFDAAGTYEYFCEFHANMKGTVVVNA